MNDYLRQGGVRITTPDEHSPRSSSSSKQDRWVAGKLGYAESKFSGSKVIEALCSGHGLLNKNGPAQTYSP